jgi:hypothetical protein
MLPAFTPTPLALQLSLILVPLCDLPRMVIFNVMDMDIFLLDS